MKDVFVALTELRARSRELKDLFVLSAPEGTATRLRETLYELEVALYALERAATDAYAVTRRA